MKHCNECVNGRVALYLAEDRKTLAGWYCWECGKKFSIDKVRKLDGVIDDMSAERLRNDMKERDDE